MMASNHIRVHNSTVESFRYSIAICVVKVLVLTQGEGQWSRPRSGSHSGVVLVRVPSNQDDEGPRLPQSPRGYGVETHKWGLNL
jgi:hypothetical protein